MRKLTNDIGKIVNQTPIHFRVAANGDTYYYIRSTVEGVRIYVPGATKSEVKTRFREELVKLKERLESCEALNNDNTTLNEYIEHWLATYKLGKIQPSSYDRLCRVFKNQIQPSSIGNRPLKSITKSDIQSFIDEFGRKDADEGLARSGMKRLRDLLTPCFCAAYDDGIIAKNPCTRIKILKEDATSKKTKEQRAMTDGEIKLFTVACLSKYKNGEYRHRDGLILLLILNLGLRAGEMLALEWSDVDLDRKIIHINKTIQDCGDHGPDGQRYVVRPATKSGGTRDLATNDTVLWLIEELKSYDERKKISSPYVCATRKSTRETPRNLLRCLSWVLRDTGITDVNLHTLRHTFGSTLIRRGVDVAIVSKLMGHADINITYKTYIHILQQDVDETLKDVSISEIDTD